MAELIASIQEQAHKILATTDIKDMFFLWYLLKKQTKQITFTWEGV